MMKSLNGKPHRGIIIFFKTELSLDRDYEEGLGISLTNPGLPLPHGLNFLLPYSKKCFALMYQQ